MESPFRLWLTECYPLTRQTFIPRVGDCCAVFAPCGESFAFEMRKGDLRGFSALSSRAQSSCCRSLGCRRCSERTDLSPIEGIFRRSASGADFSATGTPYRGHQPQEITHDQS